MYSIETVPEEDHITELLDKDFNYFKYDQRPKGNHV